MLPLHTHARHVGVSGSPILKVVTRAEANEHKWPKSQCLMWSDLPLASHAMEVEDDNWAGLLTPSDALAPHGYGKVWVNGIAAPEVIKPGDVIRLRHDHTQVSVLYRRGANANALFATERCNSLCLMCSQPPRTEDDQWRVRELLDLIPLIDRDEQQIGITGGEPTLLGDGLIQVLDACRNILPDTTIHTLSNGRRFGDRSFTQKIYGLGSRKLVWGIPLYADVPAIHDYVVQSHDAFDQTLSGLLELARWDAAIEIRVVLHQQTVPRLRELGQFIYRNLPFVRHVALMGLEPMGYAKSNRDKLWIDPLDYASTLADTAHHLATRGLNVSIYNLPLCLLPRDLWQFARQSISDWKNAFPADCTGCAVQNKCSGFFGSAGPAWRSRGIKPILIDDTDKAA